MDFLFDNPLASMYGPYFLIFYSIFNAATLAAFLVLKKRLDQTVHYHLPPIPSDPDPYEIAFLRGGKNELARAIVFSLVQKKLLKIQNDGKIAGFYLTTEAACDPRLLKPIEQTALGWFKETARGAGEIFKKGGGGSLADTILPYYETYEGRLELQHFIHDDETRRRRRRLQIKAALLIAGLGLFKFTAAMLYGFTNVWGIVILCALGLLMIAVFGKLPRQTWLGKAYLERLQLAFDQLKTPQRFLDSNQPQTPTAAARQQPALAAVDPLLLSVGVFGGAVLAGTMYDDYNQVFQKANQSTGTASSCGTGCGSSSGSSDGGGSCSGGGGCGGCGGGGGCGGS